MDVPVTFRIPMYCIVVTLSLHFNFIYKHSTGTMFTPTAVLDCIDGPLYGTVQNMRNSVPKSYIPVRTVMRKMLDEINTQVQKHFIDSQNHMYTWMPPKAKCLRE